MHADAGRTGDTKRLFRVVSAAAAVCLTGGAALAANPDYSDDLTTNDFAHSIELMVNGYTGTETLTNFPVLVRVSESGIPGFDYDDMSAWNQNKTTGKDLAFFLEDGTRLASENDTWNHNGESLIWVRLPQMTQGTRFLMCYNSGTNMVTNANPWAEYVGVWHLGEAGGKSQPVYDSTINELEGVTSAKGSPAVFASGMVGKARRIATDTSNNPGYDSGITVDLTDTDKKAAVDTLAPEFTASFWYRPEAASANYEYLLGRKNADGYSAWALQFGKNQANTWSQIRVYGANGSSFANSATTGTADTEGVYISQGGQGQWHKMDCVWTDDAKYRLYSDGVLVAEGPLSGNKNAANGSLNLSIGGALAPSSGKGGRGFNGEMDEVRVRTGVRSADWIKADFDTVNNATFVTTPPSEPPTVSWANGESAAPGISAVSFDSVTVAGTVLSCGDADTCGIQIKCWPTDGSEPDSWTTLTSGLDASDTFSVAVANLSPSTAYTYALRPIGNDENPGEAVFGTFTTIAGLAVSWSTDTASTGISNIGVHGIVVAGTVSELGGAESCSIEGKVWADGDEEPVAWTTLESGLGESAPFSHTVDSLSALATYHYALRAVGNDGEETTPVTGTFTTLAALAVSWSSASGATGLSRIGPDFAVAGGTVSSLGDAASCDIEYKVWADGGSEPSEWTTLAEGLAVNATFSGVIPGLDTETTYHYILRAATLSDAVTVSGTFATDASEGSPYTHFYDDGTNAYWVANDFERYLQFEVTGYTGTETLTNFPVLVEVRKADTNGFTYDDFYHYDGSDVAFVDETGHLIPHEIDTWNKNGMSLIWVRLPEMNNGTKFTMCYRSPLVDPLPDVGNTFEKYIGVWHMNEKEDGVVSAKDSTANHLDGETHAESLAYSNGRIGGTRRVAQEPGASSSFGRIVVWDKNDILRTGVGNVFTYSCWSKLVDTKPGWAYLVSRHVDDYSTGWGIQYHDNAQSAEKIRVFSGANGKNNSDFLNIKNTGYSHTEWAYWTFVFSNQSFQAYLNGVELTNNMALTFPTVNDENATFDHLVIGGQQNGTGALNGYVDEARYSKGVRSADWVKAEYDSTMQVVNWNDPEKRFVTKGTQVGRGAESKVPVVVWEERAGLPVSIVDVSYAYVQFAGTVTFCGTGATNCDIEYQIWADGETAPSDSEWITLVDDATAGTSFSIPVTGLKQDMPYNFQIRAVNIVDGKKQSNRYHTGSFRTSGNVNEEASGELLRVDNKFCHLYRAGSYTFTTPDYVTNIEIMVVGGGGAGGYKVGGGGGGGGLFYAESFPVTTSTVYKILVGEGGNAATNLAAHSGDGENSYFALASDEEHPLILVPGGGGGGSESATASIALGRDGASGGGGAYGQAGGAALLDGLYGNAGGAANTNTAASGKSKTAAGGGGGAGRYGLMATADNWWAGGAGGVGVECSMTGETLFYGAGGGGGYQYTTDGNSYTRPGAGGAGIGGNAADVRNGIPAGSGVENTGAGGGGGSRGINATVEDEYWKGGDGGDGVVLIAYEVHGRDPISEDPRIEMTRCVYDPDATNSPTGVAEISFRAYWAGIQAQTNDIYVLYSTVSAEDVLAGNGERMQVSSGAIGVGTTEFIPPAVGYTYWIRVMAKKDASSFMYSDEVESFFVPAVTLNGATWIGSGTNASATVSYKLHDPDPEAHLYCYLSESRDLLEGDSEPTGDGVRYWDLGTGMTNSTAFTIDASEGLDRSRVYYVRLAAGDDAGWRRCLSVEIAELADVPGVILDSASWAGQIATVNFTLNTTVLDPADTDLVAIYSKNQSNITKAAVTNSGVTRVVIGNCASLPNAVETSASFPLPATEDTTIYVRLGLYSAASNAYYWSAATRSLAVTAPSPSVLYIYANANAKKGVYGDEPQALDYEITFGGATEGPGFDSKPAITGALACAVTSTALPDVYGIGQGSLGLEYYQTIIDETEYNYILSFVGATYTIEKAEFSVSIPDIATTYTGEPFDTGEIVPVISGIKNGQAVTCQYRIGDDPWSSTIGTSYSNTWTHTVQFKATAEGHEDASGTFQIEIKPAPLSATISTENLNYTGASQTPVVTTSVTNHVKPDENPLTCEYRDEAGEWQSTVPSFTEPGEYKLFFRVSAPNHVTYTTNCTFTIAGWDFMVNMDGQTGYPFPLRVTDPGWLLRTTGETGEHFADPATRYANLDRVCTNGLKLWQNYVIARDDLSKPLVAAILQSGSRVQPDSFLIRFPNTEALRNTGLAVNFRLDRKRNGENAFTQGALSDKYEMNVPLGPDDPSGLYVFNMVLTPTNESYTGQAVLSSIATVGVLRVSCEATNVIAAVPWWSASSDAATPENVEIDETVNPNGRAAGDRIFSYDAPSFHGWTYDSGTLWRAIADGTVDGVTVTSTDAARFSRGGAFWLVRSDPGDYIYLIGRYTPDDYSIPLAGGSSDNPGFTMVGNPTMADIADLNDLVFVDGSGDPADPAADDRIVLQDAAGFQKVYVRNAANTEWGRWVSRKSEGLVTQEWVNDDGVIPSGTGFWYVRTATGSLTIEFGGAQ